jgi:hypothetical protein
VVGEPLSAPLYNAAAAMSQRCSLDGAYGDPSAYVHAPELSVAFGIHISTIVPPARGAARARHGSDDGTDAQGKY